MGGVGGRIDELEQSRAIGGGRGGGDGVVSIRRQGRRGGGAVEEVEDSACGRISRR